MGYAVARFIGSDEIEHTGNEQENHSKLVGYFLTEGGIDEPIQSGQDHKFVGHHLEAIFAQL
jgi:hypothetical protein